MSSGNSRTITSNQTGPHDKLAEIVARHLAHPTQKPFNQHTLDAFAQVEAWRQDKGPQRPLILDACCGVGESTAYLASQFPQHLVIGVDKSALRTQKHAHYAVDGDNYCVVRADLNDFWRLAHRQGWQLDRHYLLYPNPYPKSAHLQRRWHGSAAFADILRLGGRLEVRSNWDIYIQEFALALRQAGYQAHCEPYTSDTAQTPFERKYWGSGQQSWHVVADLDSKGLQG
ncbi:SAM-dependent methyltransferase [Aestuariibacter halophilus]|uniref:tRNA (guanine(46)-N(7))-methyltransferase n=1 Tax=Fluctibacter halophilus TaxID=226011 RepID=A0ABS8G9M8_9ALTE|nr:SAM-dependent methyltransferase [Aestuariibacter halophilus]MCC2617149.1 SAM-dependent methyltransferase [Aestuariibacter halophilus]